MSEETQQVKIVLCNCCDHCHKESAKWKALAGELKKGLEIETEHRKCTCDYSSYICTKHRLEKLLTKAREAGL